MASLPLTTKPLDTTISEEMWEDSGHLPCLLTIDLPLKRFTVGDLLRLERGAIVESENANGAHVPVTVNRRVIGWAEFEAVENRVAIRMTELA